MVATTILGGLSVFLRMQHFTSLYASAEQEWVLGSIIKAVFMLAGFTVFRATTIDLSSSSREFQYKLLGFILFEAILVVATLVSHWQASYYIDMIVEQSSDPSEFESSNLHTLRLIAVTLSLVFCFAILFLVGILSIFLLTVSTLASSGTLGGDSVLNLQNQRLIRNMKKFPFGNLLFKEAQECAICLDRFSPRNEIVQL
mmetsp:Transcript_24142/g.37087  ORF Transcript_24142/g.37087 Transcript_24142/m.37087 type:complete len:200 (+) Transcript_24142:255-854(+)